MFDCVAHSQQGFERHRIWHSDLPKQAEFVNGLYELMTILQKDALKWARNVSKSVGNG
ncbi:hypothetical protein TSMEX_004963 [Taenia solium]|eukprot:TsM_000499400 transcript=TsM_000499400 gene=TsM_000499400